MNPAVFSQIVTALGILGVIAASVQEAYGAQSHWGMIAGIAVTVLGKVGAILAASQATKADMQESAQDHAKVMATIPAPSAAIINEPASVPVPKSQQETALVPAIQPAPKP